MNRTALVVPVALLALTGAAGTSSAAPTREPALTVPADMTVEAEAATGAGVSFKVSAVGRENQTLPVTCSPASGSNFPLGQTTVTCTAQDRPDEVTSKSFRITVADRTSPRLVVPASVTARERGRSRSSHRDRRGRLEGSPAGLETGPDGDVLQRPALPRRSPDPERLAQPAQAPTARCVDAPRTTNGAEPSEVRLVRLAGLRRSRARRVRQFARAEHLPRAIERFPRSRVTPKQGDSIDLDRADTKVIAS